MSLHRNEILGGWELVSFQARDTTTGEVRHPLGVRPRGLILYTDDGFMSAQLAPEGAGTDIGDYIAYSGPFHVDEQASTVRHDVRMATMPDLVTQPQLREVSLAPGQLTLSATMTDETGTTTHSTLVWQRPAT
jgi:hypothetical protein